MKVGSQRLRPVMQENALFISNSGLLSSMVQQIFDGKIKSSTAGWGHNYSVALCCRIKNICENIPSAVNQKYTFF